MPLFIYFIGINNHWTTQNIDYTLELHIEVSVFNKFTKIDDANLKKYIWAYNVYIIGGSFSNISIFEVLNVINIIYSPSYYFENTYNHNTIFLKLFWNLKTFVSMFFL